MPHTEEIEHTQKQDISKRAAKRNNKVKKFSRSTNLFNFYKRVLL
jgi:hypothetical protein